MDSWNRGGDSKANEKNLVSVGVIMGISWIQALIMLFVMAACGVGSGWVLHLLGASLWLVITAGVIVGVLSSIAVMFVLMLITVSLHY